MWPGQNLDVTWKGLRPGESVVARLQVEPVPGDPIRQLYLEARACMRSRDTSIAARRGTPARRSTGPELRVPVR